MCAREAGRGTDGACGGVTGQAVSQRAVQWGANRGAVVCSLGVEVISWSGTRVVSRVAECRLGSPGTSCWWWGTGSSLGDSPPS